MINLSRASRVSTPINKPALMILGTTSNAGKSILAAAFCRIFTRRGLNVSPFKAQNMSLNSFVTRDNCEMGRAQVVQAQASKKDPDVRMNPILLKPNSTTGSQIIVMGKPVGSMNIREYTAYKKEVVPVIHKAYDELAADSDLIVLEGAGSPAEINLKADDIVNMAMAKYANAHVLLCGDIDRGGVYAHFIGTLQCLDPEEQAYIKGFLVNRFRGDASLLAPAHEYIINKTGKPVVGVIPYINDIAIPDEDSVSFKNISSTTKKTSSSITVAVIDLPHISNATDIDPFLIEPDVSVTIARNCDELDNADVIIIPGSKNVINDLRFLNNDGFSNKLRTMYNNRNVFIVGICGGLQILGNRIFDTHGIENTTATECEGLGFLDVATALAQEKMLTLTTVIDKGSNTICKGYEIHHGRTVIGEHSKPIHINDMQEACGAENDDGRVWGTYLHGIFDNNEFRRHFIDKVRLSKGYEPLRSVQADYNIESSIDRLADHVENSVDMPFITGLLGLK
jgi:adenosylcobyric acid synthase